MCALEKIKRLPFPSSSSKSSGILDLIHSDVCGPMEVTSVGGKRYVVTFIDDYSRKVFVTFLRTKDQVFEAFFRFKARAELECGRKIKVLRSDRGGEYINSKFQKLFADTGIKHETSVAYCPESNGVAEWMNSTMISRARCMLIEAELDTDLWAEALNTAVYLINRSPNSAIDFAIPEERYSGKRTSLNHLRVFGSKCVMQRPKQHRRKWDRVRESGVLVGYSEKSKAYQVLMADKDVREERNVKVFDRDDDRSYIEVPANNPSVEESVQEELSEQEVSDDELMFFSSSDQEDEVYGLTKEE